MSDEALLLEYQSSRNKDCFAQLVHRFGPGLYVYLQRCVGDPGLAEDVFQTTFLQLHLKCDQFQQGRTVRPWLYRIARNQAIDALRSARHRRSTSLNAKYDGQDEQTGVLADVLTDTDAQPLAKLQERERRSWTRAAVARLPDRLRRAVELVYLRGLKYREAADILSIPVGTVKSRVHNALRKLSRAWNDDCRAGCEMSPATLVAES
ncbi:MAG: RNA polymerase sigma factor [Planctomycetota bacterium]|jgi:RNA polymerase sigma-70 factor (ECF subfamily)